MLRRIPAVKWAFTRLRPLPHGGSIDVVPIAASESPAIVADIAEAVAAPDSTSTSPLRSDTEIAVASPLAEDRAAISVIPEIPSAAPTDISIANDSSLEAPTEVESVVLEEVSVSPVEVESEAIDAHDLVTNDPPAELQTNVAPVVVEETPVPVVEIESGRVDAPELVSSDPSVELPEIVEPIIVEEARLSPVEAESRQANVSEPVIGSDPSPELSAEVELVVVEEALVSSFDIETAPVDAPVPAVNDDTSADVADVEPSAVEDSCVALADSDASAEEASESSIDSAPLPIVAMEIEPVPANDSAPVAAEGPSADTASVVTHVAPEPVSESPAPVIPSAPKTRAKVVEPIDRATLIRQRWAETGIRMWNPRLHGAGDAALNIQGRVELLPPAPGETMPRYDKLEFRMSGGQIVCEGVVVEAPASAGHRSFTQLAEPRNPDRTREPIRERQAALA
ncbi:hypothetical protein [Bradyrhizobium sp. Arg816]|uniref:hypothetical protein n=1 Tax=Bradyrhizobium sp. Arg816 TaxID=2998491 RepID=UPI00249F92A3|nr:hypothetical protein [Bradyrhizobium sp. Arg816]